MPEPVAAPAAAAAAAASGNEWTFGKIARTVMWAYIVTTGFKFVMNAGGPAKTAEERAKAKADLAAAQARMRAQVPQRKPAGYKAPHVVAAQEEAARREPPPAVAAVEEAADAAAADANPLAEMMGGSLNYESAEMHFNHWAPQDVLKAWVYGSESPEFAAFDDPSALLWSSPAEFEYAQWETHQTASFNITVPPNVYANGSYYAHVFLTRNGASPDPAAAAYDPRDVVVRPVALTKLKPKRRVVKQKKLLVGSSDDAAEEETETEKTDADEPEPESAVASLVGALTGKPREMLHYWSGNLTINYVPQENYVIPSQMPPFIANHYDFLGDDRAYKPMVWMNDFWILDEDLIEPSATATPTLPVHISLYPLSPTRAQLYLSMQQSLSTQAKMMSAGTDMGNSSLDEFKRMMRDTNPVLLATTMIVSLLHSLFEFLAFKNEVSFWKDRKSVKGISVRSMFVNLGIQVIVFLYLLDNSTDTSAVILVSNAVGLAIEFWKVSQAVQMSIDTENKLWGIIPRLRMDDKDSYANTGTKQYDDEAFALMKWVMYPLLAAYAVYSLLYSEHKSWYSYILNTAVGAVYMFGFMQSLPQLYVNYKLQSVAHMNGRTMAYKFLTTIVDDFFVFIIRMPWLQRLAAFRDDVVFIIYLIQRYKYPVDHTRVNEFGQGGAEGDEDQEGEVKPLIKEAGEGEKGEDAEPKSVEEKKNQ
ncbi:hypothetical protein H9P43_009423 [Blastocladiella emersonii ATCC 22665]|nr:hypothetical protein H9P43_009423 [Blastocladiella emersonii ATCC 22665]